MIRIVIVKGRRKKVFMNHPESIFFFNGKEFSFGLFGLIVLFNYWKCGR